MLLRSEAKIGYTAKFHLNLCFDVLLEVLRFGDRGEHRLTKLERVGRRFHLIVENFIADAPFLRLDFELHTKLVHMGSGRTNITRKRLRNIPSFVRFDTAKLEYRISEIPIEEKCEFFESHLLAIKSALKAPITIEFHATISQAEPYHFSNHFALLEHLRNRFLPICDRSYHYQFNIWFTSDKEAIQNVIASILQMPQVNRCPNIEIDIGDGFKSKEQKLPIEAISKWLEVKRPDNFHSIPFPTWRWGSLIDLNQKENSLTVRAGRIEVKEVGNLQALVEHLKKKFCEAEFQAQPFTFCFANFFESFPEIEEQTLKNWKTGEVFSVNKSSSDYPNGLMQTCKMLKVKRAPKKTENNRT